MATSVDLDTRRIEECTSEALAAGAVASAKALAVSATVVGLALRFSPGFRRATGVSSRAALIISPVAGAYFLQAELAMNACSRRAHHANAALRRAEREQGAAAGSPAAAAPLKLKQ